MSAGSPNVHWFWAEFRMHTRTPDAPYKVWAFGDRAPWSDELCRLVVKGRKRATAALRAEADAHDLSGGFRVVVDGSAEPHCVVRITGVEVRTFGRVDEAFAREEGEGDLSLDYWREAHRHFFTRRAGKLGIHFDESIEVVLTRFEKVWPDP